jgi:hypothetical protein
VLEYPEFCRGVFSILRTHRQHQKKEQGQRYGKPPYQVCKSGSASLLTVLHALHRLNHYMCSIHCQLQRVAITNRICVSILTAPEYPVALP